MKKLILCLALITGAWGHSYAQEEESDTKKQAVQSKTDKNFNMPDYWVNVRDYVYLPNDASMIIELTDPEQYRQLKQNIDSILGNLLHEIAFYKDSLTNGTGTVRIDYSMDNAQEFTKFRFKKHLPDGDVYIKRYGDIARLKIEQDSIRILIRYHTWIGETAQKKSRNKISNTLQLTFCLNNYTDIAAIVADKAMLQHTLDTLLSTRKKGSLKDPVHYPSSIKIHPYDTTSYTIRDNKKMYRYNHYVLYDGLLRSDDNKAFPIINRGDMLEISGNVGAGLVRNTLAPYGEIGLGITHYGHRVVNDKYASLHIRGFMSSYFFFERNAAGDYLAKPNWFANIDFGSKPDYTFGVGYLVSQRGDYFKGTTAKVFMNIRLLKKGFTLSPELIFTNNFKQIIPGITLKAL